jgi:hypothetical protein
MHEDRQLTPRALSDARVDAFISDGFIRIDGAFPRELAEEARTIMWRDLPCDPGDPTTWARPVIRLPGYGGGPFEKAANTPILHAAFDRLVGKGRWLPRNGLGTFPVRFPHPDDPVIPGGTSMSVFLARTATPMSARIFPHGAST